MQRSSFLRRTPLVSRTPVKKRREEPRRGPAWDALYRSWIASLPCLICGGPAECCHVGDHAYSQKASDYHTVPLCRHHHQFDKDALDRRGQKTFERIHKIDLEAIIERLADKPKVFVDAGDYYAIFGGAHNRIGRIVDGLEAALASMWELWRARSIEGVRP